MGFPWVILGLFVSAVPGVNGLYVVFGDPQSEGFCHGCDQSHFAGVRSKALYIALTFILMDPYRIGIQDVSRLNSTK